MTNLEGPSAIPSAGDITPLGEAADSGREAKQDESIAEKLKSLQIDAGSHITDAAGESAQVNEVIVDPKYPGGGYFLVDVTRQDGSVLAGKGLSFQTMAAQYEAGHIKEIDNPPAAEVQTTPAEPADSIEAVPEPDATEVPAAVEASNREPLALEVWLKQAADGDLGEKDVDPLLEAADATAQEAVNEQGVVDAAFLLVQAEKHAEQPVQEEENAVNDFDVWLAEQPADTLYASSDGSEAVLPEPTGDVDRPPVNEKPTEEVAEDEIAKLGEYIRAQEQRRRDVSQSEKPARRLTPQEMRRKWRDEQAYRYLASLEQEAEATTEAASPDTPQVSTAAPEESPSTPTPHVEEQASAATSKERSKELRDKIKLLLARAELLKRERKLLKERRKAVTSRPRKRPKLQRRAA